MYFVPPFPRVFDTLIYTVHILYPILHLILTQSCRWILYPYYSHVFCTPIFTQFVGIFFFLRLSYVRGTGEKRQWAWRT